MEAQLYRLAKKGEEEERRGGACKRLGPSPYALHKLVQRWGTGGVPERDLDLESDIY